MFSAVRFDVGDDYFYYYGISTQLGKNFYASDYWFNINYDLKYNLFKLLSDISFKLEAPQLPIIIFSFLTSFFIYKSINRFSIDKRVSTLFYVCFPLFYFSSFSTIKQNLALAIFLFSIRYIFDRRFLYFFVFLGISFYIHPSVLFLIPVFFIYKLNVNRSFLIVSYLSSFFISSILKSILTFFGLYMSYFESTEIYGIGGSKIIYIVNLIAVGTLLIYNKVNFDDKARFYCLNVIIGCILYNSLSVFGHLGMRSSMYFLIFSILLMPNYISYLNKLFKNYVSFKLVYFIMAIALFNYTIYTNSKSENGSSVVPYKVFINKSFYDLKDQ